ncbi:MAG UNVERIFIED_CONTAM: hypothetical protein LVR29_04590 [Microcystis novacekii LVE1205-3]
MGVGITELRRNRDTFVRWRLSETSTEKIAGNHRDNWLTAQLQPLCEQVLVFDGDSDPEWRRSMVRGIF